MSANARGRLQAVLAILAGLAMGQNYATAQMQRPSAAGSLVLTGAENNIPHLSEIGWDTDLPFLLTVRFLPQKLSFAAGWSQRSLNEMFIETGQLQTSQPYPWGHFFVPNAGRSPRGLAGLSPEDMAKFQDWSVKRAAALPRVIVHSVPFFRAAGQATLRLRPLNIREDEEPDNQQVDGVGFATMVHLRVDRPINGYAVSVPAGVVDRLPTSGLRLETRVRWRDPEHVEQVLRLVSEPLSLRLVSGATILWEHVYGASGAGPAAPETPSSSLLHRLEAAATAAAPDTGQPDIVARVQDALIRNRVLSPAQAKCIQYDDDSETPKYVEFAVREVHINGCPGDPNTAPRLFNVRYEKLTGAVFKENDEMTGFIQLR